MLEEVYISGIIINLLLYCLFLNVDKFSGFWHCFNLHSVC